MSTRKSDLTDQPPGQKNLADILRRIEGEILRGRWAPGTRIPAEWELCERFGASRPMVREALQSLKARGLVVSRRGSGRFIPADPGWHGMSDLISTAQRCGAMPRRFSSCLTCAGWLRHFASAGWLESERRPGCSD